MLGRTALAVVTLTLGLVGTARAGESPPAFRPGPEVSFRLGPSFVMGNADRGQPLRKQVGVPLAYVVDGGYRLSERFYVGGFWAMGFGFVSPRPCAAGFECDAPGLISSVGAGGRFHVLPESAWDPWVGTGLALDIQGYKGTRTEHRDGVCVFGNDCNRIEVASTTLRFGASLLFEGGLDYRLSKRVGLGISAAAFVGKYLTTDTTVRRRDDDLGGSGGSVDGGYHVWLLTSGRFVAYFN